MHVRVRMLATAVSLLTIGAFLGATPASARSEVFHGAKPKQANGHGRPRSSNLSYHGGSVGVQTSPKVYLVTWNWNGSDPSGEESYFTSFLNGVGGSSWNNSVSQDC